jgi:hypothetical protein
MAVGAVPKIAAVVVVFLVLSACESSSKDVGADMAACTLEEMKTNYPDKANNWRDVEKAVASNNVEGTKALFRSMTDDRLKYVSLCMRARGWEQRYDIACTLDQVNCYVRAKL